jgi:hypothetical protein
MADKASFTADEWTKLLESVAVTGMAVTASDPSGIFGMLKEAMAGGALLASIKSDPNANPLIKAAVGSLETKDERAEVQYALQQLFGGAKPNEIVPRSLNVLREVSVILDQKAPADAPAFKAFLNSIALKVAEASKEGGFLGIGGVPVSDAEKATLAQIADALGTAATS